MILDTVIVLVAVFAIVAVLLIPAVAIDNDAVGIAAIAVIILVVFLGPGFYYVYFVGNERGQTYGRRALSIQVRDGDRYGPLGYGRALGRYLIVFLLGILYLPLVIDYLWPLWDRRNQTLHDKMVGSVVIRV